MMNSIFLLLALIAYIAILYILFTRSRIIFYTTLIVGVLVSLYIGYRTNSEDLTEVIRCSRKYDCFKEKLTEKDLLCIKNYTDYCKRAATVKELL
jgi:asparagine N-glycosylation enzyme membrane subunit Stt3